MKTPIWFVLILTLAGCGSNPFGDATPMPVPKKLPTGEPGQKFYSLTAPSPVNCDVGAVCTFQAQFSVTNDQAVLSFENLPQDATADATTGIVQWTPPATAAGQGVVVLVDLKGAGDDSTQRQVAVLMLVKASP